MATAGAGSTASVRNTELVEEIRLRIRHLAEERDLVGLAVVAEKSLRELRMLCERPNTCSELGEMLDGLERLKLDALETDEE